MPKPHKYKMNLLATTSDQYYTLMAKANRFFLENEKESAEIIAKTFKVDLPAAIGTYRLTRPTFSRDGIAMENE